MKIIIETKKKIRIHDYDIYPDHIILDISNQRRPRFSLNLVNNLRYSLLDKETEYNVPAYPLIETLLQLEFNCNIKISTLNRNMKVHTYRIKREEDTLKFEYPLIFLNKRSFDINEYVYENICKIADGLQIKKISVISPFMSDNEINNWEKYSRMYNLELSFSNTNMPYGMTL